MLAGNNCSEGILAWFTGRLFFSFRLMISGQLLACYVIYSDRVVTCATTFIRNSLFTTVKPADKPSHYFSKIEVYHIFSTIVVIVFRLIFKSGKSLLIESLELSIGSSCVQCFGLTQLR